LEQNEIEKVTPEKFVFNEIRGKLFPSVKAEIASEKGHLKQ